MASNDHCGNKTAKELILRASKLLDKQIETKGKVTFHDWLTILAILTVNETSYDVADFWAKAFDIWCNKARENAKVLVSNVDRNRIKTGHVNHNTDNSGFDEEQLNKEIEQFVKTDRNLSIIFNCLRMHDLETNTKDCLEQLIAKALDIHNVEIKEIPEGIIKLVYDERDINILERWLRGDVVLDPNDPTGTHGWKRLMHSNQEQKKTEKPTWKFYQDAAYEAANEATRCLMRSDILNAQREYYMAQNKYFDTLSQIYQANETFKFDLYV